MTSSFGRQLNHSLPRPLFRYVLIGVVNNLLGYLAYLLLTYWGVDHKVAMTILYLFGATLGFFSNRQWAFAHQGSILASAFRYCVAHFCGYLTNLVLLVMFVDKLGYPHQLVQAAAIIIVAGFLYIMFKLFVFRDDQPHKRAV